MTEDIFETLRQAVYGDPALQARLFDLTDADQFIAAIRELAQSSGHTLEETSVRELMQTGRRAWFERNLA